MKIERQMVETMTLEAFATRHNLTMQVFERGKDRMEGVEPFYAHFKDCDVIGDGLPIGTFGNGNTEEEAIHDYQNEISEKQIKVGKNLRLLVPRLIDPPVSKT